MTYLNLILVLVLAFAVFSWYIELCEARELAKKVEYYSTKNSELMKQNNDLTEAVELLRTDLKKLLKYRRAVHEIVDRRLVVTEHSHDSNGRFSGSKRVSVQSLMQ